VRGEARYFNAITSEMQKLSRLADRLAAATDRTERKRIKEALARLVFGRDASRGREKFKPLRQSR
jgi:hypothetical protein